MPSNEQISRGVFKRFVLNNGRNITHNMINNLFHDKLLKFFKNFKEENNGRYNKSNE